VWAPGQTRQRKQTHGNSRRGWDAAGGAGGQCLAARDPVGRGHAGGAFYQGQAGTFDRGSGL